jgi:predicted acetyltransferase
MEFKLVEPSIEYKESYLAGLRSFQREGLPWHSALNAFDVEVNFGEFVKSLLEKPRRRTDKFVPETELWGIADGLYAGRISIRHELNENLKIEGGHIGYDTVPEFRGRGVATRMLAGVLPVARRLGLERVLLTCNDSNAASIRVIEKNGGALEAARMVPGKGLKRYYWIDLK